MIENAGLIVISSQVINEFVNVCIKKSIFPEELIFKYANEFMGMFDFHIVGKREIRSAIYVKRKYKLSYWDSLIVASALESSCSILYTEDLQYNQKIEKRLKILNPFVKM